MKPARSKAALTRTDRLARGILEASPDCIILLNSDGTIVFLNGAGVRLLELDDPQRLIGLCWMQQWPTASRDHAVEALKQAQQGGHGSFAGMAPTKSGRQIWWDVTVSPIHDCNGNASQLVVIARDVTIARQAFQEADLARRKLAMVLGSTTDNIVAVDHDWNLTYLNERAASLVGLDGALSVGSNMWEVYPDAVGSEFHQNYVRALETQNPVQFEGYLGELGIWLDVHAFPTVDGLSIFFRDVTETKRIRDELSYLAHYDALTGLPNRAMFVRRLSAAMEAATLGMPAMAVVYVDLDDFKAVNDTLGHDAGDTLLAATAKRLTAGLAGRGLAARIGGDEFAILLEDNVSRASVEEQVLELQSRFAEPVPYSNVELTCRASIGIALYPESDARLSELLKNADLALYQAKRAGGKQYAFFDPRVREAIQKRVSALSCARDALERDAIIPFYQPKVSFRTDRIIGFEALLRWVHPREGVLPPFQIKDAFEDPILSVELGQRMLAQVIRDMQSWKDRGLEFGSVAINVSAPEFARGNYSATILESLRSAQLHPSMLEIEVTETVFLDDGLDRVEIALTELHRNGVSIALDDFGTGYASLTHLSKFPVSWLKIDRSFVNGLGVDPDATAIVKAVMGLSHSMGIGVVAEGIETMAQWKQLKRKGCDLAQGYLISKPICAEQVPAFLASWSGVCGIGSTSKPPLSDAKYARDRRNT